MSQDSDSDKETAPLSSPRWRSGVRTPGRGCSSFDPHEAYLAGMALGPVMRNYRSARVRRAKRKAQRRQMLALMIPVLAFAAAFFGKGFWSSGMQELTDLGGKAIAAAGRGEIAEAVAAFYEAIRSFGSSITVRKLLLPIFLTVVLRMARAKIIDKINHREGDNNEQEETGAAANADAAAGLNLKTFEETESDEAALALSYEWPRRMQHAFSGLVILGLYLSLPFYFALACVLIAIVFLYHVRLVRWMFPRLNGVYVQLLSGIIRPVERNPSNHPAALPFLWGCLLVLIFSNSRSLAVLCVLLLSVGDPAAGVARRKCMRRAAAAAAAAATGPTDTTSKADDGEEKTNAGSGLPRGCCCSSNCCSSNCCKSSSNALSKRCFRGFFCCTVACAVSVVLLALCFACLSRDSRASEMQKNENSLLRAALDASGLAYPWPSLHPVAADAAAAASAAASVSVGSGLLEGDMSSWVLLLGVSLLIGVIASIGEIINVAGIDDNLTMPIFCLVCLASVFGVYVHLKGLAGSFLGPLELSAMNRFDEIMLLLFAL